MLWWTDEAHHIQKMGEILGWGPRNLESTLVQWGSARFFLQPPYLYQLEQTAVHFPVITSHAFLLTVCTAIHWLASRLPRNRAMFYFICVKMLAVQDSKSHSDSIHKILYILIFFVLYATINQLLKFFSGQPGIHLIRSRIPYLAKSLKYFSFLV